MGLALGWNNVRLFMTSDKMCKISNMHYVDNDAEGGGQGSDIEETVDDLAAAKGTVTSERSFDRCVVTVVA